VTDALPGRPAPLGATPRDGGTNFAVASGVAEGVEVCLFDDASGAARSAGGANGGMTAGRPLLWWCLRVMGPAIP